jgi:hypothetical protein
MSGPWYEEPGYVATRNHPRPLLLGYVRADALTRHTDLVALEADLGVFAQREEFSLGTVYVAKGDASAAFHALLDEMNGNEAAWGIVVPDVSHVTDEEHLLMRRRQQGGARTTILVANFSPPVGRPGPVSFVRRQVCPSTQAKIPGAPGNDRTAAAARRAPEVENRSAGGRA